MTLEQIANWKSQQNPLEKVYGKESVAPTITTRVAESIGGGINASTILISEDFDDVRNLRKLYQTRSEKVEEKKYSDYSLKKIKENIVESDIVGTITSNAMQSFNHDNCHLVENNYRIRKLIPRECLRLMGVKDEDIDKMSKNQSNSSLYHLAGDSIVVDVLMAIFNQML